MEERPHFRILGVPVRVRASFFIVAAVLGWGGESVRDAALGVARWMAIVFASVLLHELGHAFVGRAFGLAPSIQIHGFGGLTSWPGGKNVTPARSLVISLAGPAVSFLLFLGALAVFLARPSVAFAREMCLANGFWAAFNVMPIMPLDGGNAMRSLLLAVGLRGPAEIGTRAVGIALGAGLAIPAGIYLGPFVGLFLASYVVFNVQSLARYLRERRDVEALERLRAAYPAWLAAKDGRAMIDAALAARAAAKTDYLRAYATELYAMGQCLDGDARSALATLESSMPAGMLPGLGTYLHVLFAAGEDERARRLAQQMLDAGDADLAREARAALTAHGA